MFPAVCAVLFSMFFVEVGSPPLAKMQQPINNLFQTRAPRVDYTRLGTSEEVMSPLMPDTPTFKEADNTISSTSPEERLYSAIELLRTPKVQAAVTCYGTLALADIAWFSVFTVGLRYFSLINLSSIIYSTLPALPIHVCRDWRIGTRAGPDRSHHGLHGIRLGLVSLLPGPANNKKISAGQSISLLRGQLHQPHSSSANFEPGRSMGRAAFAADLRWIPGHAGLDYLRYRCLRKLFLLGCQQFAE